MSWQLIMILQNTFAALFAVYSRSIAKKYKNTHFQSIAIIFTIMYIFGLSWAFIHGNIQWSSLQSHLIYFVGGGLAFGISNVLSFKVFEYMDTAVASLLSTLNTVAAVVASTLLIHEGLTMQQTIGGLVLIAAMWLVLSLNTGKKTHKNWMLGVGLSTLAAVLFGLAIANEKHLLGQMNLSTYLTFGWGFQWLAVICSSLLIHRTNYGNLRKPDYLRKTLISGCIRTGSGFLFILALIGSNNSSLVSVLSGFKVVLAALLGMIFLREKQYIYRKLEAATLSVVGVALMLWK